uniref:Uncharacterized protein n=1 Tax=Setaria viridis TaxID=4556 RepID=A0A4V6D577_SETVI|nr:hypothetical protein SEVIR_6G066500v2 [Setaria viridis]
MWRCISSPRSSSPLMAVLRCSRPVKDQTLAAASTSIVLAVGCGLLCRSAHSSNLCSHAYPRRPLRAHPRPLPRESPLRGMENRRTSIDSNFCRWKWNIKNQVINTLIISVSMESLQVVRKAAATHQDHHYFFLSFILLTKEWYVCLG